MNAIKLDVRIIVLTSLLLTNNTMSLQNQNILSYLSQKTSRLTNNNKKYIATNPLFFITKILNEIRSISCFGQEIRTQTQI